MLLTTPEKNGLRPRLATEAPGISTQAPGTVPGALQHSVRFLFSGPPFDSPKANRERLSERKRGYLWWDATLRNVASTPWGRAGYLVRLYKLAITLTLRPLQIKARTPVFDRGRAFALFMAPHMHRLKRTYSIPTSGGCPCTRRERTVARRCGEGGWDGEGRRQMMCRRRGGR